MKEKIDLTFEDKGWLAAAIDGEGFIYRHPQNKYFQIGVVNSNKKFLKKVLKLISAKKIAFHHSCKNKDVFIVRISGRNKVLNTLKQIKGILIIKKEIAEKIIKIIESSESDSKQHI